MTDFLTRIAERTLGLAPVAQPIIAPLFAPGPAIPASAPAALEIDEMQEAPPSVQKARPSITRTVPQSPVTRIGEESTSALMQPSPETIGTPIPTQAGQPVFSQQEEKITPVSPAQHSLQEASTRSNPINEPVSPVPIASAPPSPIEEVKEITATSARDIFANQQPARTLVDTQATPLETHAHRLVTPPEEYSGEKQTAAPPTQASSTPSGSARLEEAPLASKPHIASPQALPQEVTEISEIHFQYPQASQGGASQGRASQDLPGVGIERGDGGRRDTGSSLSGVPYDDVRSRGRADRDEPVSLRQQARQGRQEQQLMGVAELSTTTPTIRVTIGRIDVRAVTPSEPTARAKPTRAAPRISLEDYARQNKQGGR